MFRYYPKMYSILCVFIIDGVCYGFLLSELTRLLPEDIPDDDLNLFAGLCSISMGCGASLGGWISGQVASRVDGKSSGYIGLVMFLFGNAMTILTLYLQDIWLANVTAFIWGFYLFYIEGWLYIVCSREFKGSP